MPVDVHREGEWAGVPVLGRDQDGNTVPDLRALSIAVSCSRPILETNSVSVTTPSAQA